MLQVPLTGGASAQEGPLVLARALASAEASLDAQAADISAVLGAASAHNVEEDLDSCSFEASQSCRLYTALFPLL